jgi:hypothetical protein
MTVAPRVPDHEQRDAHLLAALQHAPDRDVRPPPALSAQILLSARQAVQPAPPAVPARPWKETWLERLLQWQRLLTQPATAGALATLAVATVIGLMWRSGVPANEEQQFAVAQVVVPEAPAPAPATEVAAQAPAALARAAPAPVADAAAPAKAEQAANEVRRLKAARTEPVRRESALRQQGAAPPVAPSRGRIAGESSQSQSQSQPQPQSQSQSQPDAGAGAGAGAAGLAAAGPAAAAAGPGRNSADGADGADEAAVAAAPAPAAMAPATADLSADPWADVAAALQERPGAVGLSAPPGSQATPPLVMEYAPLSSARRAASAERAGPPEPRAAAASAANTAADAAAGWLRRVHAATRGRWQPVTADALAGVNLQAARTVLVDGAPAGRLVLDGRGVLWLPQAAAAQAWRADLDAPALQALRAGMPGAR